MPNFRELYRQGRRVYKFNNDLSGGNGWEDWVNTLTDTYGGINKESLSSWDATKSTLRGIKKDQNFSRISGAIKKMPGQDVSAENIRNLKSADVLKGAGQILKAADKIAGIGADIVDMAGAGIDEISQATADRFGSNAGNKLHALAQKSGTLRLFEQAAGKRLQDAALINNRAHLGGMSSTLQDAEAVRELSGKRVAFDYGKYQTALTDINAMVSHANRLSADAELVKSSNTAQLYQQQNFNRYSGNHPKLLIKNGIKFPELEEAKEILLHAKQSVKKYQLGGKITSNYIPEGALHRNKHHIIEAAPELEGKITEKGIPVVSIEDAGAKQHAEIEGNELTLSLDTTKKIEGFYKSYEENPSEDILLECGKYFVNEILKNTEDPGKLIKEL